MGPLLKDDQVTSAIRVEISSAELDPVAAIHRPQFDLIERSERSVGASGKNHDPAVPVPRSVDGQIGEAVSV